MCLSHFYLYYKVSPSWRHFVHEIQSKLTAKITKTTISNNNKKSTTLQFHTCVKIPTAVLLCILMCVSLTLIVSFSLLPFLYAPFSLPLRMCVCIDIISQFRTLYEPRHMCWIGFSKHIELLGTAAVVARLIWWCIYSCTVVLLKLCFWEINHNIKQIIW